MQDNTIDSTRCANGFGLGLTGVTSLEAKDSPGWNRTFGAEGDNRFLRNHYTIPAADGGLNAKRYAWTTSYQRTWSDWHGTTIAQDPGGTATPGN